MCRISLTRALLLIRVDWTTPTLVLEGQSKFVSLSKSQFKIEEITSLFSALLVLHMVTVESPVIVIRYFRASVIPHGCTELIQPNPDVGSNTKQMSNKCLCDDLCDNCDSSTFIKMQ